MKIEMDFSPREIDAVLKSLEMDYQNNGRLINGIFERIVSAARAKIDGDEMIEAQTLSELFDEHDCILSSSRGTDFAE